MARYAHFDNTVAGGVITQITGWYDTDVFHYPNMPDSASLLGVTDEAWNNRGDVQWGVLNGVLTPMPLHPLMEVPGRMAQGISITCTGDQALDATYSMDLEFIDRIRNLAIDYTAGLGLPENAPVVGVLAMDYKLRYFSGDRLVALYRAQRDLGQHLIDAAKTSPLVWPEQTATIP